MKKDCLEKGSLFLWYIVYALTVRKTPAPVNSYQKNKSDAIPSANSFPALVSTIQSVTGCILPLAT